MSKGKCKWNNRSSGTRICFFLHARLRLILIFLFGFIIGFLANSRHSLLRHFNDHFVSEVSPNVTNDYRLPTNRLSFRAFNFVVGSDGMSAAQTAAEPIKHALERETNKNPKDVEDGKESRTETPLPFSHIHDDHHDEVAIQPLLAFHHTHDQQDSLAALLYRRVRIFCFVLTSPTNSKSKAVHVNATWAPRCNKHVFITADPKDGLPSIDLDVKEERKFLWGKTKRAFKYIFENELSHFDWFLKADDDTYVVLENLRLMLASHSPQKPIYFGCRFKPFVKQGYMSGGSGYVLSREAVRRFALQALPDEGKCKRGDTGSEDLEMGKCLEAVGVEAGDSRDKMGRHRMLPFSPLSHFESGKELPKWFHQYMFYAYKQGSECCSDFMVSFHYVTKAQMYAIHNLLYHVRPFGQDSPIPAAAVGLANSSLLLHEQAILKQIAQMA